ncbi:MAG: hypothetical protein IT436_02855 [Phycisphaerales bacterium]|nr:hypothetical protein [Phycisphaerales bacterium]
MRPRRRTRKLVKWGGAVLLLLTAAAWIVSMFGGLYISTYPRKKVGWSLGISAARGAIAVSLVRAVPRPTEIIWDPFQVGFYSIWKVDWRVDVNLKYARVPLWMPGLFFAAASGIAWRLDIRDHRRGHHCPSCSYDRSGLAPAAPCPECGKSPA